MDVQDYIHKNGVTSMSKEYSDILSTVIDKYGADISDPFELAASLFVGKNPRKLIYSVSHSNKDVKYMLDGATNTKNWIISNQDFLNKYGDAGYIFAPAGNEYNPSIYNWMQAAGLVSSVGAEEFLRRTQVAIDKQTYFDIEKQLNDQLSVTADSTQRAALIAKAENMRNALKIYNPLLAAELNSGGLNVDTELSLYDNIKSIVKDSSAPLNATQRKVLNAAIALFEPAYQYVSNPSLSNLPGYAQLKLGMRNKTLDELNVMAGNDRMLKQIISLVFKPILKFHSRDSVSANPVQQNYTTLGQYNG